MKCKHGGSIPAFLITIIFLVAGYHVSQAQERFHYEISGHIEGMGNDTLVMTPLIKQGMTDETATGTLYAVAKDGRFYIKGTSATSTLLIARIGRSMKRDGYFYLFLEEGKISMNGTKKDLEKVKVSGTPSNDDYSLGMKQLNQYYEKRSALYKEYQKFIEEKPDTAKKIMGAVADINDALLNFMIGFAQDKHSNLAGAMFVYLLQDRVPINKLEELYTNLSPHAKSLSLISEMPNRIEIIKKNVIGSVAADFERKDMHGNVIRLSDYRGRYVLLEFWASWCGPCRAEYPFLKQTYAKFKDKGFEIIGVSADTKDTEWRKAINQDGLSWVHISELRGGEDKIFKMFGVQPIPDNFLIDPNGKIIARGLRGKEVDITLSEVLK